jgi:DNA-binding winged helix-turn-helix (wHTH) protein
MGGSGVRHYAVVDEGKSSGSSKDSEIAVTVHFAEFTFDRASRQLLLGGTPVHLSPKAFDVLRVLLDRRPEAVSKEDLLGLVWSDTFVVEASLTMVIAEIRRALGDQSRSPRFVRTVQRYGYAFCAEAHAAPAAVADRNEPPPAAWLVWNSQTLALRDGENTIGRDPRSHVWLDVAGVSRRHARISLAAGAAVLEDLGSKNGTAIGSVPVRGPATLTDGDVIECGPVALQFRRWSERSAVATERLHRQ